MTRLILTACAFVFSCQVLAQTGTTPNEVSAFKVAKLFFAARAAVGEKTAFTDDPTNPTNNKTALLDAVNLSYERMAGEKLNVNSNPFVSNMWMAINIVIDRAMAGGYKGKWVDHPNFPGKLVPARFGNEITAEYNASSANSRVRWTTSNEYLVNPKSQADEWELKVINTKFKLASWKQGESYTENVKEEGQPVFRYALPEYFKSACMNCHGGEMGKIIHKGKGVAGTGTFGGVLSVKISGQ
jgi:hypothetical protein